VRSIGKPVRVAGTILLGFAQGQIVDGWNSWDQLGLLRQIGALGEPGRGDRFLAAET
jgi:predicted ester cyclase